MVAAAVDDTDHNFMPERKEVDAVRVASPTLAESAAATRKSEVALYDMAPKRRPTSDKPQVRLAASPGNENPIGSGWVLVNVEATSKRSAFRVVYIFTTFANG